MSINYISGGGRVEFADNGFFDISQPSEYHGYGAQIAFFKQFSPFAIVSGLWDESARAYIRHLVAFHKVEWLDEWIANHPDATVEYRFPPATPQPITEEPK
jgi:hypothetical protein